MKMKKKELKTKRKRRMMRTIIQKIDVVPDHFEIGERETR